jgi:hypothetical protein
MGESDEGAVARRGASGPAAEGRERQRAVAGASLAIEEAHAERHAGVAARLALVDLACEPGAARGGVTGRALSGEKLVPGPEKQEEQ